MASSCKIRRYAVVVSLSLIVFTTLSRSLTAAFSTTFGLRQASSRTGLIARSAYATIQRRDYETNEKLKRWVRQQIRLNQRQEAGGAALNDAARAAYLQKLGLGDKIKAAKAKQPWHLNHMKAGEVYVGFIEHPDVRAGMRTDIALTVQSPTQGMLECPRANFEGSVDIEQDFPITFEPGEQRDQDIAAYIFQKYNNKWRDFEGAIPVDADMQHLSLPELQLFFFQVAEVKNFPPEDVFREACSDPEKGISRADFLKFIKDQDPEYLETLFSTYHTGRRFRLIGDVIELQGDFHPDEDGFIHGYGKLEGKPGAAFMLELKSS